ncbi:hypothetical protein RDV78_06200 [Bacillota bacterium LX-D]|nr:hypothetical protein [Bacillota bacterium LX-D]
MVPFKFNIKEFKSFPVLLAMLVIGIALLIPWHNNKNEQGIISTNANSSIDNDVNDNNKKSSSDLDNLEKNLELRLQKSLSQIEGAGNVDVTVILSSGPKYDYAVNVNKNVKSVSEKDQSGGTRVTTENTEDGQLVVLQSSNTGNEVPVIAQEFKPDVKGVLVIAAGANNPLTKEKLAKAVETLLDVEPYKVDIQAKE